MWVYGVVTSALLISVFLFHPSLPDILTLSPVSSPLFWVQLLLIPLLFPASSRINKKYRPFASLPLLIPSVFGPLYALGSAGLVAGVIFSKEVRGFGDGWRVTRRGMNLFILGVFLGSMLEVYLNPSSFQDILLNFVVSQATGSQSAAEEAAKLCGEYVIRALHASPTYNQLSEPVNREIVEEMVDEIVDRNFPNLDPQVKNALTEVMYRAAEACRIQTLNIFREMEEELKNPKVEVQDENAVRKILLQQPVLSDFMEYLWLLVPLMLVSVLSVLSYPLSLPGALLGKVLASRE